MDKFCSFKKSCKGRDKIFECDRVRVQKILVILPPYLDKPWSVRLTVRTSDFHSGNRGSIPLRTTKPAMFQHRRVFCFWFTKISHQEPEAKAALRIKSVALAPFPIYNIFGFEINIDIGVISLTMQKHHG